MKEGGGPASPRADTEDRPQHSASRPYTTWQERRDEQDYRAATVIAWTYELRERGILPCTCGIWSREQPHSGCLWIRTSLRLARRLLLECVKLQPAVWDQEFESVKEQTELTPGMVA